MSTAHVSNNDTPTWIIKGSLQTVSSPAPAPACTSQTTELMTFANGRCAAYLLPQSQLTCWWAARGQWERSGAESTLRLYYSVVPLPAADASPAHSRSSASSSGSWIIQFPSKCNISWRCSRRISIRATAWSYRYDLHALPLLSAFFFLSFFLRSVFSRLWWETCTRV